MVLISNISLLDAKVLERCSRRSILPCVNLESSSFTQASFNMLYFSPALFNMPYCSCKQFQFNEEYILYWKPMSEMVLEQCLLFHVHDIDSHIDL